MNKTFSFAVTDEQVCDRKLSSEAFGVNEERAKFLVSAHTASLDAEVFLAGGQGNIEVNDLKLFLDFIDRENLSGGEIAYLAFCGYRTHMTIAHVLESLHQEG